MSLDREQYLVDIEAKVEADGIAIQGVAPDDDQPNWSYTVGLTRMGHPEVVVYGLPFGLAGDLLRDLSYAALRSGMRFEPEDRVHRLLGGGHAWLLAVPDPGDDLGVAEVIRDRRDPSAGGMPLQVLQLVYPDAANRWPWEAGHDGPGQRLLAAPPRTAGRDVELPPAEIRRAQGW